MPSGGGVTVIWPGITLGRLEISVSRVASTTKAAALCSRIVVSGRVDGFRRTADRLQR